MLRGYAMEKCRSKLNSWKNILTLTALFCLVCLPACSAIAAAADDHFGQNLIYPDYPQKTFAPDYFIAGKPTVTVDASQSDGAGHFQHYDGGARV